MQTKAEEPPKRPANVIYRAELEYVLQKGPGWFLLQVPITEQMENKKFVGWRVQELPVEWKDVDLQPGDVVTTVNAMPLETPNDFFSAWSTLSVASELKVAYLRDGEARELSFRIEGAPDPALAKKLHEPPKQEERPKAETHKTVVIEGENKPLNETMVDWSQ